MKLSPKCLQSVHKIIPEIIHETVTETAQKIIPDISYEILPNIVYEIIPDILYDINLKLIQKLSLPKTVQKLRYFFNLFFSILETARFRRGNSYPTWWWNTGAHGQKSTWEVKNERRLPRVRYPLDTFQDFLIA